MQLGMVGLGAAWAANMVRRLIRDGHELAVSRRVAPTP